jgi:hypothetical protein
MSTLQLKNGAARARAIETSPAAKLLALISARNEELLSHRYFRLCRSRELGREHMLEILKQLYCFSVFFERLLTRRISEFSSWRDQRVLKIARDHLREEIGHSELFHECLTSNGVHSEEIARVRPKLFTKAMFGYLATTLQHENEYVFNVAIMQVMESIGAYFFKETLSAMEAKAMQAEPFARHAEEDEGHPRLGVELLSQFDEKTTSDCVRVVEDMFRLMGFVLDEWLGLVPTSASIARRRRSSRPPRAN